MEAELRQLARRYLRRERPGHVLQTTALVNEAFIRLMNWQDVSWQNRAHFVAMAARLMRHILVDISRRRSKGRDGREIRIVEIAEAEEATLERSRDLVAIDDALRELAERDREAQIVELRFYGGSPWKSADLLRGADHGPRVRRRVRGCTGSSRRAPRSCSARLNEVR